MTSTATAHATAVKPEGNGHRAACSCGWQGNKRAFAHDARREARDHVAKATA